MKKYVQEKKKRIIISTILIICAYLFYIISYFEKSNIFLTIDNFIGVILIILIDFLFFKNQIYSHHILSLSIISIVLAFNLFFIFKEIKKKFLMLLLKIVFVYSNCFFLLLIKYLIDFYFYNIFLFGNIKGIINLLYAILLYRFEIFEKNNTNNILLYIIYFIVCLIYYYLYYYLINNIGPIHTFICILFSNALLLFISNLRIIDLVTFLFIFIICLIYLEILQLHFCGLSENCEVEIKKRCYNNDFDKISNTISSISSSKTKNELFTILNESLNL